LKRCYPVAVITGEMTQLLRCPNCRSLDWYRSGVVVAEAEDGHLQFADVGWRDHSGDSQWSCAQCAYESPAWSRLSKQLDSVVSSQFGERASWP